MSSDLGDWLLPWELDEVVMESAVDLLSTDSLHRYTEIEIEIS